MTRPVLFIGGMDSSGGAGLLRDCATAQDFGIAARVAVTAVTAQTDHAVDRVQMISPETLGAQILAAGRVSAIKIGMLGTAAHVAQVARHLPDAPLVLDPVLVSSSGHVLLEPDGVALLLDRLVPRARVITPNLPELRALGGTLGMGADLSVAELASALLARGCGAVLVKGGHDDGTFCEDWLYTPKAAPLCFRARRLSGSLRGTGCQLASAIAVGLAGGQDLCAAIEAARLAVLARFQAQALPV